MLTFPRSRVVPLGYPPRQSPQYLLFVQPCQTCTFALSTPDYNDELDTVSLMCRLFFIVHLGCLSSMMPVGFSQLGDTALGMSVRVFPERLIWGWKTFPSCILNSQKRNQDSWTQDETYQPSFPCFLTKGVWPTALCSSHYAFLPWWTVLLQTTTPHKFFP